MLNLFKKAANVQNIDAEAFQEIRKNNPDAVLLDVRTHMEHNNGHIPGSILLNLQDALFHHKLDDLDRDKHYLLYCRSGNRSMMACRIMDNKGFRHLYNLRGGIIRWPYEVTK